MILGWYSYGNQGKYWWNWWKLSDSEMVYIHWRTATNNLGKRFDPPIPPLLCNAQIYTGFFWVGLPLQHWETSVWFRSDIWISVSGSSVGYQLQIAWLFLKIIILTLVWWWSTWREKGDQKSPRSILEVEELNLSPPLSLSLHHACQLRVALSISTTTLPLQRQAGGPATILIS